MDIIAGNGDGSINFGFALPDIDGMEAAEVFAWFLTSLDVLKTNFAADEVVGDNADNAPSGGVSVGADFTSLGAGKYVDVASAPAGDATFVIVCRNTDTLTSTATRPFFFKAVEAASKLDAGRTTQGDQLYINSSNQLTWAVRRWNGSVQSNALLTLTIPGSATAWRVLIAKRGAGHQSIKDMVSGLSATGSDANTPDVSTGAIRVGASPAGTSGANDGMAFMELPLITTTAFDNALFAFLQEFAALHGVPL